MKAIQNAIITRLDNNARIVLGRVNGHGKGELFRAMQSRGEEVCAFLDDLGDFGFEWLVDAKVWIFTDEDGVHVATLRAEVDGAATRRRREAQYREQLAAWKAQNS